MNSCALNVSTSKTARGERACWLNKELEQTRMHAGCSSDLTSDCQKCFFFFFAATKCSVWVPILAASGIGRINYHLVLTIEEGY